MCYFYVRLRPRLEQGKGSETRPLWLRGHGAAPTGPGAEAARGPPPPAPPHGGFSLHPAPWPASLFTLNAAGASSRPCTLPQICCQSSQMAPALFYIKSTASSFLFSAFSPAIHPTVFGLHACLQSTLTLAQRSVFQILFGCDQSLQQN